MQTGTSSKKSCFKCDKSAGAFTCDGCQRSFCSRHVAEHRQELISQMDHIEQEHDIFHEDLLKQVQKQNEHVLFERIDQWQKESMSRIEEVANQSRTELKSILDNIGDYGKKSLNKIVGKLRRAREHDDFLEKDLTRWTQQLSHLRAEIEAMSNSVQMIDENSPSAIQFIRIGTDQLIETSTSSWTDNFAWIPNMKAMLYDRSHRSQSTGDNGTNDRSTQTTGKESIEITQVNNTTCSVDLENTDCQGHDQDMTGWALRRDVDGHSEVIFRFPDHFILKYQSNVRILCGPTSEIDENEKEVLVDKAPKSWQFGSSMVTHLIDDHGEEKASILQTLPAL